jgi:hypothetical protein
MYKKSSGRLNFYANHFVFTYTSTISALFSLSGNMVTHFKYNEGYLKHDLFCCQFCTCDLIVLSPLSQQLDHDFVRKNCSSNVNLTLDCIIRNVKLQILKNVIYHGNIIRNVKLQISKNVI